MSIQDVVDADLPKRLTRALSRALSDSGKTPTTSERGARSEPAAPKSDNVVALHPGMTSDGTGAAREQWPLPGLAPMTRVRTIFGDVHSIALRKGDEVLTRSGDYMPILWLKRIRLDQHILETKPDSNPIVIGPGAIGNSGELMVSPRQMVCPDGTSCLTDAREASMLISHAGVRRLRETGLTYTMFHVGRDAEVYCEGLYLSFPMEA